MLPQTKPCLIVSPVTMRPSARPTPHLWLGTHVLVWVALLSACFPCSSATTLVGSVVNNADAVLPTVVNLYQMQTGNVSMELTTETSAQAIASLLSSDVDFSVIGTPLSAAQATAYPNITIVPVIGGAVVAVYRLDALNSSAAPLIFKGQTLALIYAGNITNWAHPLIQADNPGVALPDLNITVAYQADTRGFTSLFLAFLVKSEPSIASVLPPINSPPWPLNRYAASYGGVGDTGVAAYVVNSDGAVGYGLQQSVLPYDATIARLVNKAGYTVAPTQSSIEYAMLEMQTANNLTYMPDLTDPS